MDEWVPDGYVRLVDEIERKCRERFGDRYPEKPGEADIEAERRRRNGKATVSAPKSSLVEIVRSGRRTALREAMRYNLYNMQRLEAIKVIEDEYNDNIAQICENIIRELRSALSSGRRSGVFWHQNDGWKEPIPPDWWDSKEAGAAMRVGVVDRVLLIGSHVHPSPAEILLAVPLPESPAAPEKHATASHVASKNSAELPVAGEKQDSGSGCTIDKLVPMIAEIAERIGRSGHTKKKWDEELVSIAKEHGFLPNKSARMNAIRLANDRVIIKLLSGSPKKGSRNKDRKP